MGAVGSAAAAAPPGRHPLPTHPPAVTPHTHNAATGFLTPEHKAAVKAFLTYAARYKDVWFVTHSQLIDWMKVKKRGL